MEGQWAPFFISELHNSIIGTLRACSGSCGHRDPRQVSYGLIVLVFSRNAAMSVLPSWNARPATTFPTSKVAPPPMAYTIAAARSFFERGSSLTFIGGDLPFVPMEELRFVPRNLEERVPQCGQKGDIHARFCTDVRLPSSGRRYREPASRAPPQQNTYQGSCKRH